ncbi:MAG: helix-turn-helix domain-containing protein [Microbispora sp.]|nr:helix-turn-helix domain-containing protein [Microbispora sp.]
MAAKPLPERLFTVPEAAEYLRTSENHVYRLIAAGVLDAIDVSQPGARKPKTRVTEEDMRAYLASRTRSAKRLRIA